MTMIPVQEYLKAPCAALSIPYWKAKAVQIPDNMRIVHQRDMGAINPEDFDDEPYFRLRHSLEDADGAPPDWLQIRTAQADDLALMADIINASYADLSVDAAQLAGYTRTAAYDGALWVIAWEGDSPVGCGIADLDRETREGSLEWIQVLPEYRRRGVGRALVTGLLRRMRGKADFATVSGKINNETAPERLYRRCGFEGNDIWHVLTQKE